MKSVSLSGSQYKLITTCADINAVYLQVFLFLLKVLLRKVRLKLIKVQQPMWLNHKRRHTKDLSKIFESLYPLEWLLQKVRI